MWNTKSHRASQYLEAVKVVNSKYLKPRTYMRKVRLIIARNLLKFGIPLKNLVEIDGFVIKFLATSFVEYFLRAEESYVREKVTMYWIRNYINSDDVIYDVGANVGAYSLLIGKIGAEML